LQLLGLRPGKTAMSRYFSDLSRYVSRFGPHEWFIVLAIVIVVGLLALRGFGSRSKY